MNRKSILALLSILGLIGPLPAAIVLLTDNFDTGSYGASTFNDYLATDQGGTLATIPYTMSAPGGDWSTQHSNGGGMLIANAAGNNWVSLNHNFATDANSHDSLLEIQFDARVTDGATYAWLGFGLGSAQGTDFYSEPFGVNFTQGAGAHTYKFVFSNLAGTGSAFNGVSNGAKVDSYLDSVFQSSTYRTLSASDGYLTFKQDQWDGWSIGHVDNLSISLIPEPQSVLLGGLGLLALLRRRRG